MKRYSISGLRITHHHIIDKFLAQEYGDLKTEVIIDDLRQRYRPFPNEALYIVDYKYAQLDTISGNLSRLLDLDGSHQNDIGCVLTHVSGLNYDALLRWVETMLDGMFIQWKTLMPEEDMCRCIYLSRDNKVFLKSTTPLVFDSKTMRYSLGKLVDVTDLVPFQHFGYRFDGPNREEILNSYQKKMRSVNILTARETEILKLIGAGKLSTEISHQLFISRLTVDKHRRNIIEKLGVSSAMEAYYKSRNEGYF